LAKTLTNKGEELGDRHGILLATVKSCVEQALETASLMLGGQKSRGYCLEMICADFLAGANLENPNPEMLLLSVRRLLEIIPKGEQRAIIEEVRGSL